MMVPGLRCLIVDDSPTFCAAVRDMLDSAGMPVVDTVSTLAGAVEAAVLHHPDVVLVNVRTALADRRRGISYRG
jgi:DNA-binding NarL/FixJ family response regulator